MKKQLQFIGILVTLLCSSNALQAQWQDSLWVGKQAYNWVFPIHNGLNFATDPVSQIQGALTAPDTIQDSQTSSGSISDSSGQLLFSNSFDTVFDKNFQQMVNGGSIISHWMNVSQGLIVPIPNSNSHYLFHMLQSNNTLYDHPGTSQGALLYSKIDMDMENGLGAVVEKNVLLDAPMSSKATAVHHADRERVWVVGHGMQDYTVEGDTNNKFYAYLVSESGISPAVISEVDPYIVVAFDSGQMKISPDGSKIALFNGSLFGTGGIQLYVYDFDNETGQISNPINLNPGNDIGGLSAKGIEFSPNSQYLYVAEYGFAFGFAKLHQFDLASGVPEEVVASRVLLAEEPPFTTFAHLQLAPDGKIYMANPTVYYQYGDPEATSHLSIIHNPNNAGTAANFEHLALPLNNECMFGLPNFIQSYFESGLLHEGQCVGEEVTFSTLRIADIQTVAWDFGDPNSGAENTASTNDGNSMHVFSGPGTYTITATITSNDALQTATTQVIITQGATAAQPENLVSCNTGTTAAVFDLNTQQSAILGSQDPALYTVSYHTTEEDAASNTNPIPEFSNYTSSGQIIYARVTSTEGCFAVTEFGLEIAQCNIPLGISPNGDELNDRFDLSTLDIQNLEVFNRFGQSVYTKQGYTNEWYGQTDNGNELPSGTYFYVLKMAEGQTVNEKQVVTGWVYVIRQGN